MVLLFFNIQKNYFFPLLLIKLFAMMYGVRGGWGGEGSL
mgnify:CR=1 FL=1